MTGPGPIPGYSVQKGLMSEVNAAAADHEEFEHRSDLDAEELHELEQEEYDGRVPTPPVQPAQRRTLLDRLLRRSP